MNLNIKILSSRGMIKMTSAAIVALLYMSVTQVAGAQEKNASVPSSNQDRFGGKLNGVPLKGIWDFGYVPIDYTMIYETPLENLGRDSLRIVSVKSSCQCTSPSVTTEILAPGQATPLVISYNTKNFYGPQSRFVEVFTSDRYAPERIVQFQAVVGGHPKGIDMRPRSVFNLPGAGADTIKIRNTSEKELRYSVVYQDTTLFQISSDNWVAPANGYGEVYVTPDSDLHKGVYFSTFTLEFNTQPPVRMSTPVKIVRY